MLSLLGIFYLILSNYWRIGKNKVHFYVVRDKNGSLWLYLGKPVRKDDYFIYNNTIGYSLKDIADMNIKKVTSRDRRNKIHGDGDYR